MAETVDKRRRTDLDLFILALIDAGLSTLYDFQRQAGLSQGATVPALQRLLQARFVLQGKPGARGRTGYRVSAAGKKALGTGWRTLIAEGPTGNFDADLRVALLVVFGSGDRKLAAEFLHRSAADKMKVIADAEHDESRKDWPSLARWYTDLRLARATTLAAAESQALLTLADSLPLGVPGQPTHNPRRSRTKGSL